MVAEFAPPTAKAMGDPTRKFTRGDARGTRRSRGKRYRFQKARRFGCNAYANDALAEGNAARFRLRDGLSVVAERTGMMNRLIPAIALRLSIASVLTVGASVSQAIDPPESLRNRPRQTRLAAPAVAHHLKPRGGINVVEVKINGRGPFRMAIDTSATYTTLDDDVARQLGLEGVRMIQLPGAGEAGASVVALESVVIGDSPFEDFEAVVTDLDGPAGRRRHDGVLGMPVFAEYQLVLDYPRNRLIIRKGELPEADGREILDYHLRDGKPAIVVALGDASFEVILDSGERSAFTVPESMKNLTTPVIGLEPNRRRQRLITDADLSQRALKDTVTLGKFQVTAAPVDLAEGAPRLGSQLLRRFVVVLDQKNRRLRFLREETDPITFPVRSRFGFVFVREGTDLEVLAILPGTVASKGVVVAGDVVPSMNGRRISAYSDDDLIDLLRETDFISFIVMRGRLPLMVGFRARDE